MPVTTNTRKLAALLGASGAGIGTDGLLQAAAVDANVATQAELDALETELNALETETDEMRTNQAIIAIRQAADHNDVKYNLQDRIIDNYYDNSGIDTGASTNETLTSGVYEGGESVANPTGGTITSYSGFKVHTFTSSGNFVVPAGGSGTIKGILMVGGGGAGGGRHAGGGGGGEVLYGNTDWVISAGTYAVVIGEGGNVGGAGASPGTGSFDGHAKSGVATTFNGISADGGGGGGNYGTTPSPGAMRGGGGTGGSGGGQGGGSADMSPASTGGPTSKSNETTPFVATAYGNQGGLSGGSDGHEGGGGAGAGAQGGNASSNPSVGGAGGAGKQINDFNQTHYWGGGGGGHGWQSNAGVGGLGGGGGGSAYSGTSGGGGGSALNSGSPGNNNATGGAGGTNTGGGGGGGHAGSGEWDTHGGNGGSGILKIKYVDGSFGSVENLTLQSTDTEAETQPDYADMIILVEDAGTGVGVVNTDIKGFISRDSGTTFTEGTLVDEGDWGTDKRILAFHDLDISAQPADKTMCYKITTLNASGVKNTKIHATSIGWK